MLILFLFFNSYLSAPDGHLSMISAISVAGATLISTHGLFVVSKTRLLPLTQLVEC